MDSSSNVPSTLSKENGHPPMFIGVISDIRTLIPIIRSIFIKPITMMSITDRGLKICCEGEHCTVQATIFLTKSLFNSYEMADHNKPETICFQMGDLLNALAVLFPSQSEMNAHESIYGPQPKSSSVLEIKYESTDCLKLKSVNGVHTAKAQINVFQPREITVFEMNFINKIQLDASVLIQYWSCADMSSTQITVRILDCDPWLEFTTESETIETSFNISAQSAHIEHYECTIPKQEEYSMVAMKWIVRPLLLASKICLRMNAQGLLNIQFLINLNDKSRFNDTSSKSSSQSNDLDDQEIDNIINQLQKSTTKTAIPNKRNRSTNNNNNNSIGQECFIEFYIVPKV